MGGEVWRVRCLGTRGQVRREGAVFASGDTAGPDGSQKEFAPLMSVMERYSDAFDRESVCRC